MNKISNQDGKGIKQIECHKKSLMCTQNVKVTFVLLIFYYR